MYVDNELTKFTSCRRFRRGNFFPQTYNSNFFTINIFLKKKKTTKFELIKTWYPD